MREVVNWDVFLSLSPSLPFSVSRSSSSLLSRLPLPLLSVSLSPSPSPLSVSLPFSLSPHYDGHTQALRDA